MTILSKASKPDNFESHNSLKLSFALQIFEAFVQILLNVNLSLNQTFLTFLPCVRQTWLTQLILAISPWEVIFLWSKRILVLICMVLQFMLRKTSFCTGLVSIKLWRFLLLFLTGFTSLSVLLLFPLSITFFIFVHSFLFYFI